MTQAFSNLSNPSVAEDRSLAKGRSSDAVIGAVLVVGVPTAFWMGIIELAAIAFNFSYGNTHRLIVGCAIAGFLALIYGCIRLARG
jgi:hypothetical protein